MTRGNKEQAARLIRFNEEQPLESAKYHPGRVSL